MKRSELLIEAAELETIINDDELRLFDATVIFDPSAPGAQTRYETGHIPGAVFLDHNHLSDQSSALRYTLPDEALLATLIGNLGIGNENPVVVYSTDMMAWATRVWWVLRYAGHRNVRVLNGGIGSWTGDLETGNRAPQPPAEFVPNTSASMFANKEEVLAAVSDGQACVINTLPQQAYEGAEGGMYPGHITGSTNHPLTDLLDNNYLLSDDLLKDRFSSQAADQRMITYCGGGIAATLNAAAALVAGINDVAVYDGSMSEWIAEDLPLTQGSEAGAI